MINYKIIIFIIFAFFIFQMGSIIYMFYNLDISGLYNLWFIIANIFILLSLVVIFISSFLTKNKLRNVTVRQILGEEESKILHFSKSFVVVLDRDERIYWTSYNNHELAKFLYNKKIKDIIPNFSTIKNKDKAMMIVNILNDHYQVTHLKDSSVVLFRNISEINILQNRLDLEQFVFGYIKIDDLPILLENESNFKDYEILSMVAEGLKKYFKNKNLYFKNINRDLFIFITTKEELQKFIMEKFSILEKIKKHCANSNLDLSLSIGVGLGLANKNENEVLAHQALKKAESRRGDQAVVNEFGNPLQYFGGKSERSLKTKKKNIKFFAKQLVSEIKNAKKMIIMGHKMADFDSLGAAFGLNKVAQAINSNINSKVAWNVKKNTDKISNFVNQNLSPQYISDYVINEKQALNFIDEETLLVVVDTYSPLLVEYKKLLNKTSKVIVLDHHREGNQIIENTLATWVDAGASSTSEMVVEIIDISNTQKSLTADELNLLYTGILLDTNNFNSSKLSYRTLHSASLLKYWNANHIEALNHLKKDQEETHYIYQKIKNAIEIKPGIFFIIIEGEIIDSVVLAQIGDSFIGIANVQAVFVFGLDKEENILVSSRSNGKINVQTIMESFGGGGHYAAAATKIVNHKNEFNTIKILSDEIKGYIIDNKIGE